MNAFFKLYCRAYQTVFRLALPVLPYREPRILGELKDLPLFLQQQKISAVLLITDKPLRALDMTRGLENDLSAHGIACAVFEDVVPNPTVQKRGGLPCRLPGKRRPGHDRLRRRLRHGLCQGRRRPGGPARQTRSENGRPFEGAAQNAHAHRRAHHRRHRQRNHPGRRHYRSRAHHKYPINDFVLIPDYAVLDYRVTLGLPPMITATTGMDAMTHAVEAYIGRSTNALTRAMAEEAVVLIVQYLQRAWRDGSDAEARAKMLRAAYCAGIAFTRSYVGYVHGVAHSLGGRYGVPHGLANAVILPYFLEEYGPSCHKKLARLARKAGLAGGDASDSAAAQAMIDWIKQANAAMGIPTSIPEIRKEDIPAMAAYAAKESNPLYPVPKLMDRHELEAMYLKLMPKEV